MQTFEITRLSEAGKRTCKRTFRTSALVVIASLIAIEILGCTMGFPARCVEEMPWLPELPGTVAGSTSESLATDTIESLRKWQYSAYDWVIIALLFVDIASLGVLWLAIGVLALDFEVFVIGATYCPLSLVIFFLPGACGVLLGVGITLYALWEIVRLVF
jgi:hypothetical protein